jgi:hypothetical protein
VCRVEIIRKLEGACETEIFGSRVDVVNCAKAEGPAKTSNTLNSFIRNGRGNERQLLRQLTCSQNVLTTNQTVQKNEQKKPDMKN